MSKVYSFRLCDENPREAQAREVIESWVSEGFSIRHLMIEALLSLRKGKGQESFIFDALEQIKDLLSEMDMNGNVGIRTEKNNNLPASFVESLKISAKPGQRAE